MADIQDLLKSMKEEKDALLIEKEKGATGDASILQEFNLRRLNREMNKLCDEYQALITQNATIEDKLTQMETNPPRCVNHSKSHFLSNETLSSRGAYLLLRSFSFEKVLDTYPTLRVHNFLLKNLFYDLY